MFTFNISIFIFTVLIILTAVYYKIYRIAVVVGVIYVIFTAILFFLSKTETKTGQIVEKIEYVKSDVTPEVVDTTVSIAETTVDPLKLNADDTPALQILKEDIPLQKIFQLQEQHYDPHPSKSVVLTMPQDELFPYHSK